MALTTTTLNVILNGFNNNISNLYNLNLFDILSKLKSPCSFPYNGLMQVIVICTKIIEIKLPCSFLYNGLMQVTIICNKIIELNMALTTTSLNDNLKGFNNNISNLYNLSLFDILSKCDNEVYENFEHIYTFSCYNSRILKSINMFILSKYDNEGYENYVHIYTFSCYNSRILKFINMFRFNYFNHFLEFLFIVICCIILGTGDHNNFCTGPMSNFKKVRVLYKKIGMLVTKSILKYMKFVHIKTFYIKWEQVIRCIGGVDSFFSGLKVIFFRPYIKFLYFNTNPKNKLLIMILLSMCGDTGALLNPGPINKSKEDIHIEKIWEKENNNCKINEKEDIELYKNFENWLKNIIYT